MNKTWRHAIHLFGKRNLQKRSLIVCLIVGSILNGINQGSEFIKGEEVSMLRILLTYLVPYCVATYGALSALMAEKTGEQGNLA